MCDNRLGQAGRQQDQQQKPCHGGADFVLVGMCKGPQTFDTHCLS